MRIDAESARNRPTISNAAGQLRVSAYDRVASLLASLLILSGAAVVILFTLWLTASLVLRQVPPPVELVGRGNQSDGPELALETPGTGEILELAEPRLDLVLNEIIETIPSAIASLDNGAMGDQYIAGRTGNDARDIDDRIIPRWERWEVRWSPRDLRTYARQLDFFRIELAAAGGSPQVDYAYNFVAPRPNHRDGRPDQEARLYMTWRSGTVEKYDRTLLKRAGIRTDGRLVLQFIPENTEDQLAWIEMENAGGRSVKEFLKTVFGVRATPGNGYEFYIVEQRYRPAPP